MGHITTMIIRNDAIGEIASDSGFGRRVADAVQTFIAFGSRPTDIPAGNHGNAAMVVEMHHDLAVHAVLVGKGYGIDAGSVGYDMDWKTPEGRQRLAGRFANAAGFEASLSPLTDPGAPLKMQYVTPADVEKAFKGSGTPPPLSPAIVALLKKASEFTMKVEALARGDEDGVPKMTESEVAEAMYELRAEIAAVLPAAPVKKSAPRPR
jgi:hypothetical protein